MSGPLFGRIPARAAKATLSPAAWRLLVCITSHATNSTGTASLGLLRMSEETGIARTNIPRLIAKITDAGLLQRIRSKGGAGRVSAYQIIFDTNPKTVSAFDAIMAGKTVSETDAVPDALDGKTVSAADADNSINRSTKTVSPQVDPIREQILTDKIENSGAPARAPTRSRARGSPGNDVSEAFNAWWQAFPPQRRTARKKALKKYTQIIAGKLATDEQLLAAVQQYAQSSDVTRGFACQPLRWLNNERWLDESAQKPNGGTFGLDWVGLTPPSRTDNSPKPAEPYVSPAEYIRRSEETKWRDHLQHFRDTGAWRDWDDGPRPSEPGCLVPQHLLEEFGFAPPNEGETHLDGGEIPFGP